LSSPARPSKVPRANPCGLVRAAIAMERNLRQDSGVKEVVDDGGAAQGQGTEAPRVVYRRFFWLLVCAWTAAVSGSLTWSLVEQAHDTRALMLTAAGGLLERDVLYREWSLRQGGVYVVKSSQSETPPYPNDPDREIVTPSGQKLTLLNPAVVSRQIFEQQRLAMGIIGHLTSLRPLQSANAPDAWEQQALQAFERGVPEVSSEEVRQNSRYFRMMRPLITVPACLRCHEEQGHQLGQIRGGISVALPISRFVTPLGENVALVLAHVSLWGLGMAGLTVGGRKLGRHIQARQHAEAKLAHLVKELTESMAKVKTLSGLIPICSSCKKIRNDQGYWTQLETYLKEHSTAEFSHGLCIDCVRTLYPEISCEVEAHVVQKSTSPEPPDKQSPPTPKSGAEPQPNRAHPE
jgi:hypothetical protein